MPIVLSVRASVVTGVWHLQRCGALPALLMLLRPEGGLTGSSHEAQLLIQAGGRATACRGWGGGVAMTASL